MNRFFRRVLGIVTLTLVSGSAAAQPPRGLIVGVERAFGFEFGSEKDELGQKTSTTSLGLGVVVPVSLSGLARVGIDYVLSNGVSFGAGLGLLWIGRNSEPSSGTSGNVDSGGTTTALLFAPRVGYLAEVNPSVGLWPRAGVTAWRSFRADTGFDITTRSLEMTAEVPLTYSPYSSLPGLLLHVGPTLDHTLSASTEISGADEVSGNSDNNRTTFGIRCGIAGVF